ncbi:MAG: hypothetical protein KJ630_20185 [Proteobacteria bacterium]|nr:hypothetical protein [Pseudomonadota bacterium]
MDDTVRWMVNTRCYREKIMPAATNPTLEGQKLARRTGFGKAFLFHQWRAIACRIAYF